MGLTQSFVNFNRAKHGVQALPVSADNGSHITQQRAAFLVHADAILTSAQLRCRPTALILLEISNLRQINQRHSHTTGDRMVEAMHQALRETVDDTACIGRVGGQTFAVLLLGTLLPEIITATASELREAVAHTLDWEGDYLPPNIRVAATVNQGEDISASRLLRNAELNLDSTIEGDGADLEQMLWNQRLAAEDYLERPFANALKDGQFQVFFQPQVSAASGRLAGAEALIRWQHPQSGWVAPERIVELAEQSGKCLDLTRFIIDQSLTMATAQQNAGLPLCVSINIPPKLMANAGFLRCLDSAVERFGVETAAITLEITEQALVTDLEADRTIMSSLRDRGYGLAIDDFGKGYSALSYLREIPATELKIDRRFVARALESESDRKMLCMIVDMAHLYGMTAVAEGVEEAATLATVISPGCDLIQGWHTGKPMPASVFEQWVASWAGWKETSPADLHAIAWR